MTLNISAEDECNNNDIVLGIINYSIAVNFGGGKFGKHSMICQTNTIWISTHN